MSNSSNILYILSTGMMFMNKSLILRRVSTSPLELIQFQRFTTVNKISYSYNQCSYVTKTIDQQLRNITSFGRTIRCLSLTNRTNISVAKMDAGDQKNILHYNDILGAQKNNILIIDIRENSEIEETGKLPGSIHIPMGEVTNALTNLSSEDFKKKFNQERPNCDTKIIVSCRSGKRSTIVTSEIQKLGYKNVFNYIGGWVDWDRNQKT